MQAAAFASVLATSIMDGMVQLAMRRMANAKWD